MSGTRDGQQPSRALRERLYQRSATEADVDAYLASTSRPSEATSSSGVSAESPSVQRHHRFGRRAVAAVAAVAAVVAVVAVAAFLGADRRADDDAAHPRADASSSGDVVPVLRAGPLVDGAAQRRAGAALAGASHDGLRAVLAEIGTAMPALRSSGVAVLTGEGVGPKDLRLGPFGLTTAGRGLQIVVATRSGRYRWSLTGRSTSSQRRALADGRADRAGVISGAAVAVPAGTSDVRVRFDIPSGERFVYYLLASG